MKWSSDQLLEFHPDLWSSVSGSVASSLLLIPLFSAYTIVSVNKRAEWHEGERKTMFENPSSKGKKKNTASPAHTLRPAVRVSLLQLYVLGVWVCVFKFESRSDARVRTCSSIRPVGCVIVRSLSSLFLSSLVLNVFNHGVCLFTHVCLRCRWYSNT